MTRYFALSILLLSGCGLLGEHGSGKHHSSGTGGITADARWPAPGFAVASGSHEVSLPDEVVTVFAKVSASDMDDVEEEFDAADGEGTIDNVPVGNNRTLTLEGRDADGETIYFSQITGITVTDGDTADAGTANFVFAGAGGGLDISFSGNGIAIDNGATTLGTGIGDEGRGVAIGVDDIVIVGGWASPTEVNQQIAVWKLDADGSFSPDWEAFGGAATFAPTIGDYIGNGVALDGEGRVFVAGTRIDSSNLYSLVVPAFDGQNGTLDAGFNDGFAEFESEFDGVAYQGFGVAVDSSDRVYVTGSFVDFTTDGSAMAVWRFTENGVLDVDFAVSIGYIREDSPLGGGGDEVGRRIMIDAAGRIVVGGSVFNGVVDTAAAFRREATDDANADSIFNGIDTPGLINSDDFDGGESFANAVAATAEGDVIFAGGDGNSSESEISVWKWNNSPDDNLDWNFPFDCGGPTANISASARGLAVDDDGKILIAGVCVPAGDETGLPTLVVIRVSDDGQLDNSFGGGTGMIFVHNFEHDNVEIEALDMALDSAGRIVITGSYLGENQQLDMIVVRIRP